MRTFQNIYSFCAKHKHKFYLVLSSVLFVVSLLYFVFMDGDILSPARIAAGAISALLLLNVCKMVYLIWGNREQFRKIYMFYKKYRYYIYVPLACALLVCSLLYCFSLGNGDSFLQARKAPAIIIALGLFLSVCKTIYIILKK